MRAAAGPDAAVAFDRLLCAADGRALLELEHLRIGRGERVAVVGHRGAGKSTLLRTLGGVVTPLHGELRVLGQTLGAPELDWPALRQEIGLLLQGRHLVPRLSALDNVLIGCLPRVPGWRSWARLFPDAEVAAAREALREVGLLARAAIRADRLAGAEQAKVAIARLLLQRPQLILADEPTSGLDPAASAEICHLLARAAQRATLISVVHNPSLLPLFADRVIGLKDGRLVFDLPLREVSDSVLFRLYRPSSDEAATAWRTDAAASSADAADDTR